MFKKALLLIATSVVLSSAHAFDGNDLYPACLAKDGDGMKGICIGYVRGFIEGMQGQSIMDSSKMRFCHPDKMQYSQAIDIVANYLRDNPALRHESAGILVFNAMVLAFPCPRLPSPKR